MINCCGQEELHDQWQVLRTIQLMQVDALILREQKHGVPRCLAASLVH